MNIDGISLTPRVLEWALVETQNRSRAVHRLLDVTGPDKAGLANAYQLFVKRAWRYSLLQATLAYRLDRILGELE